MSFSNQISQLKDTADNFIGKQPGLVQAENSVFSKSLPWNNVSSQFWAKMTIDPTRWDQLFPYRLVVFDTAKNQIVGGNGSGTVGLPTKSGAETIFSTEGKNIIINFIPLGNQWIFRLPITPQQLSITDQFAINTSATLRGVIEEHSGVRFKMIQASGTMGVWTQRSSVVSPPAPTSIVQSLFGGTIEAAANTVNQFSAIINTATSDHPANRPKRFDPKSSNFGDTSTGYFHALALQQFLEQYAEAKKNPKNASWRLVFDIPKQNQSFVVTPMTFSWLQNENKPTQINYSMQMKAWRRIDLTQKVSAIIPGIQSIDIGILQRILNTISEARKLTSSAVNLIGAVRSDVERPLDVLRQTSLLIKDLAGVSLTAADLKFQIARDYKSAIGEVLKDYQSTGAFLSSISSDPAVASALADFHLSYVNREGLSIQKIGDGQLGPAASLSQKIDPSHNFLNQPEKNFTIMNQVFIQDMKLTPIQQAQVDQMIIDAQTITIDDLKTFRAVIQTLALQLSNNFGAGSTFYSQMYGIPAPIARISPMTVDEYELLKALYDVMQSYDILTATTQVDDIKKSTNMEYVAGLANGAGIDFNLPNSKILSPVPFGLTVEQIAARYLGNPQRWLEIVTLNNLRSPYIDENGFQRPLLSNATGRQITISSIENMYIGQRIVLHSASQIPSARRILGIDRLSDTSYLLSLDGNPDIDVFTVPDKAYIQVYLPGTVNSQQKIFIPSELTVQDGPTILIPTSVSEDSLVGLSKVDWLLTETGDIATNTFGDFRFSAGMTNLIQALKLKIATPKGTVLMHPEFGLGIRAGIMNSEVNVQDIYNNINKLIEEDPRFTGLDSLQVSLTGPVLSISMSVQLAGQNGVFPVTFQLTV